MGDRAFCAVLPQDSIWSAMRRWIWVGLLALGSCGFAPEPITGCAGTSTLEPDCRFQNPEDLVALPSRSGLIVSQMGAADGSSTGSIALYLLVDGSIRYLFPVAAPEVDRSWGDPGCEAPAPMLVPGGKTNRWGSVGSSDRLMPASEISVAVSLYSSM